MLPSYYSKMISCLILIQLVVYQMLPVVAEEDQWGFGFGSNDDDESTEECSREDEFDCGSNHCIDSKSRCDGEYDCANGRDEEFCGEKNGCTEKQFLCDNGQCLPLRDVCDGTSDCKDASDEKETLCKDDDKVCTSDEFRCKTGGINCVKKRRVCDDFVDCPDGSDEENCDSVKTSVCKSDEFMCESGGKCISKSLVCNNNEDCSDGADEKDCRPTPRKGFLAKQDSSGNVTVRPISDKIPISKHPVNAYHLMQPPVIEEKVLYAENRDVAGTRTNSNTLNYKEYNRPTMPVKGVELLSLHKQSLDTIQRMAHSVGLLADALRAFSTSGPHQFPAHGGFLPYPYRHVSSPSDTYATGKKTKLAQTKSASEKVVDAAATKNVRSSSMLTQK